MARLGALIAVATLVVSAFVDATPLGSVPLGSRQGAFNVGPSPFGSTAVAPGRPVEALPFGGAAPAPLGRAPRTSSRGIGAPQLGQRAVAAQSFIFDLFKGEPVPKEALCEGNDRTCKEDGTVCTTILRKGYPRFWGPFDEMKGENKVQVFYNYWDIVFPFPSGYLNVGRMPQFWGLGDGWCLDLDQYAQIVNKAGCQNVDIKCSALDVNAVMSKWPQSVEGEIKLGAAKECLKELCAPAPAPSAAAASLVDSSFVHVAGMAAVGGILGAILVGSVALRRRTTPAPSPPLLG